MADIRKRVPENAEGPIFVDQSCIDCGACYQLVPEMFRDAGEHAAVHRQPINQQEQREALHALLTCPVGAIGASDPMDFQAARQDFPLLVEPPVYFCGFNSPKSFGGNSYFIRHPDGNWLVDSPRYLPYLARRFETMGGVSRIFLTHQDDVADAERYARHFGAQRIIHRGDASAQPDAEMVVDGLESVFPHPDFEVIPSPGHTKGHMVLLFQKRFLFTGDHLSWDRSQKTLRASRDYCWYSWKAQTESMARLAAKSFEWVLPGHGNRIRQSAADMREQMFALVQRMSA
jgi:glyoxylase-like metal-dependent hydrolase (beta-lactamase superfamily II)/ferredoxin